MLLGQIEQQVVYGGNVLTSLHEVRIHVAATLRVGGTGLCVERVSIRR